MYIMKIPVLSTVHITPETDSYLDNQSVLEVAAYDTGFFICFGEEPEEIEGFKTLPQDLKDIAHWAEKNKYDWVRICGMAGDIIEDLPNYEDQWS